MVGGLLLMALLSLTSSGIGCGLLPLRVADLDPMMLVLSMAWSFAFQARGKCVCSGCSVCGVCSVCSVCAACVACMQCMHTVCAPQCVRSVYAARAWTWTRSTHAARMQHARTAHARTAHALRTHCARTAHALLHIYIATPPGGPRRGLLRHDRLPGRRPDARALHGGAQQRATR